MNFRIPKTVVLTFNYSFKITHLTIHLSTRLIHLNFYAFQIDIQIFVLGCLTTSAGISLTKVKFVCHALKNKIQLSKCKDQTDFIQ